MEKKFDGLLCGEIDGGETIGNELGREAIPWCVLVVFALCIL